MTQRTAAVEIGGTKLQAAIGTSGGEILEQARAPAPAESGAEAVLDTAAGLLDDLLASQTGKPLSIGVGFGGPIDSATGEVITSHQVAGWSGFPLRVWFQERFNVPVTVVNDANAAGWAEFKIGAGRGTKIFVYMNIGSGIGGALVVDGRLHDGQGFGAFEIGHTRVAGPDGTLSTLEDLASGWSIAREARAHTITPGTPLFDLCGGDAERIDTAMLGEAACSGDAFAIQSIDRAARTMGLAVANAITLIHPEVVAVGGGVGLLGDLLLTPFREEVERLVFGPYRGKYAIVPAALGEDVVLAGALLLAPHPA